MSAVLLHSSRITLRFFYLLCHLTHHSPLISHLLRSLQFTSICSLFSFIPLKIKHQQLSCVSSHSHHQVTASASGDGDSGGSGVAAHLSVDVKKVSGLAVTLPLLLSSPLRVALCLGFLWRELGPAALVGVTVLLLLIPVNSAVERRVRLLKVSVKRWREGGEGWGRVRWDGGGW